METLNLSRTTPAAMDLAQDKDVTLKAFEIEKLDSNYPHSPLLLSQVTPDTEGGKSKLIDRGSSEECKKIISDELEGKHSENTKDILDHNNVSQESKISSDAPNESVSSKEEALCGNETNQKKHFIESELEVYKGLCESNTHNKPKMDAIDCGDSKDPRMDLENGDTPVKKVINAIDTFYPTRKCFNKKKKGYESERLTI